jgi:hypothetical protein
LIKFSQLLKVTSIYVLFQSWLAVGNKSRATAATGMNEKSSRSHSVFTIILTQTQVGRKISMEIDIFTNTKAITAECTRLFSSHFIDGGVGRNRDADVKNKQD